jgi:hypothetical protein
LVLWGAPTPCVLVAALRLPSLGDTRPCACLRLSLRPDAGRGPGAFGSGSSAPAFSDGRPQGLSGSWGTPMCLCPVLGPRRDCSVRPYDVCSMAPVNGKTKAPTIRPISGLDSRAWARAVYASSLGSPQDDARLASGCLASFPGGIGYPQGSNERFPVCFLHPVLLSQACLTQATFRRRRGELLRLTQAHRCQALTTLRLCPPPPRHADGGRQTDHLTTPPDAKLGTLSHDNSRWYTTT